MIGVDATSGRAIDGAAHLAQSVNDILSTPIGSRVLLRDYGSLLFELVDAPLNALTRLRIIAATALAIRRWEPRLDLTRVTFAGGADGAVTLQLDGYRTDVPGPNSAARLTVPLRPATSGS